MDLRPCVLIVSDSISMRMGGEASFAFVYAKLLMARGAEVWMVGHARVREELRTSFPEAWDRIRFVEDTPLMVLIFRLGRLGPYRVRDLVFYQLIHMLTQRRARRIALELIREQGIEVVFEPTPIAPKAVSYMYGLGVPVAIGPLCGGMSFPPAFRHLDSFSPGSGSHWGGGSRRWRIGSYRASCAPTCSWSPMTRRPPHCRRGVEAASSNSSRAASLSRPGPTESRPSRRQSRGGPYGSYSRVASWIGRESSISSLRSIRSRSAATIASSS
jgi:hypothetical protein